MKCSFVCTPEEVQQMYATEGAMNGCEGLFAAWITDPAAIKAALPEQLTPIAPVCTMYSINVQNANFSTAYKEAALVIPVMFEGTPGLYPISILLEGTDNAMLVGRDQLGMPKKHASIKLYRSGDAIHTEITRLGRKIFDLDMKIGDYNDPQTAPQIFGDTSKPQDGMQYFYKYEMGQDENARIFVENLRLLSYRGVMDFSTWENAGITQISSEPSDSDPWAMFPVVKPLGGGWTNLSINLLGVKKTTPIEVTDEIVGKLILGKYDSPQIGRPTRMF